MGAAVVRGHHDPGGPWVAVEAVQGQGPGEGGDLGGEAPELVGRFHGADRHRAAAPGFPDLSELVHLQRAALGHRPLHSHFGPVHTETFGIGTGRLEERHRDVYGHVVAP